MVLQQDSIAQQDIGVQGDSVAPRPTVITPAMVLKWLPRDATPAQQDSAIQARFKPSEIHWSKRPQRNCRFSIKIRSSIAEFQ